MIQVVVMVKEGGRSETFGLEVDSLGPEEMAAMEDLSHELTQRIQAIASRRAHKAHQTGG